MNKVELIGFYGNDTTHAQSAWTSTSRDLTEDKMTRIPQLLKMLATEGHHTPFEKSSLHFLVTVDQATHIHLLKHRIGVSINGESARYKELKEDKMYFPEDFLDKKLSSNSIPATLDRDIWGNDWMTVMRRHSEISNKLYHQCLADLTPILGRKRAKESARFFKTMNSQITMDIMFNWRSFYHFLQLRDSGHAQLEVRMVAQEMLRQVKEIGGNPFKETINAFKL
ncbi:faD-dependent thymidylate synthase [Caudoviricetes sp.]|nr:faD-dependent thymidylate synthase [Caudoviricetes sp.]